MRVGFCGGVLSTGGRFATCMCAALLVLSDRWLEVHGALRLTLVRTWRRCLWLKRAANVASLRPGCQVPGGREVVGVHRCRGAGCL